MWHYHIAGITLAVEPVPGLPRMTNFEPFAVEPCPADLTYTVHTIKPFAPPVPWETLTLVSEDDVNRTFLTDTHWYKEIRMRSDDDRRMWLVQGIEVFGRADIYLPEDWLDYIGFGNAFAIEKTLLPFGVLLLHCSLIVHNDQGIAFSAPSQTGKSTQARLWETHRGAETINGDRAVLRVLDGRVWAFGSPFAGSSDLYIPRGVPLSAIVMLEQAPENTVCDLPQSEALGLFLSQTALPMWDPFRFEMGMKTLETVITTVPMATLACTPDEKAVVCLEGWLRR